MKSRLFGVCCLLLLVACGSVKDLRFTKDNTENVMEKVRKSRDLTGEEVQLLLAATMRNAFEQGTFEGKTVGQVIKEQRKLTQDAEAREKEEERLADEAKKREDSLAAVLLEYLTVAVYDKGFHQADIYSGEYQDYISTKFAFENRGQRDIRAFRGTVVFRDLFGKEIYSTGLAYDEGIKAGQKKNWAGTIKYNQFEDGLVRLRSKDLPNLKVEWKPKTILFADGSALGDTE